MERDAKAYLWDVREAGKAIQNFVAEVDFEHYADNEMLSSAVERKFEIMGEALNQLSKRDVALAERVPDYRQIVAFRNLLIHGYAAVDSRRVWRIIQESLPGLIASVEVLLGDDENQ